MTTQIVTSTTPNWQQAVIDLTAHYTSNDMPFTSGHVVSEIRANRPDFIIRQRWVGEMVQELFWDQKIQYSTGDAVQVPRKTTGNGRTPAGVEVFVYAPSQGDADGFDFEVDIPSATGPSVQTPAPPKVIKPKTQFRCVVHSDNRLCVPRAAMDALSAYGNTTITQDTEVFVSFDGDQAIVSFENHPTAVNYKLHANRGRILFPRPGTGQFTQGDMYEAELETVHIDILGEDISALALDFSNAL